MRSANLIPFRLINAIVRCILSSVASNQSIECVCVHEHLNTKRTKEEVFLSENEFITDDKNSISAKKRIRKKWMQSSLNKSYIEFWKLSPKKNAINRLKSKCFDKIHLRKRGIKHTIKYLNVTRLSFNRFRHSIVCMHLCQREHQFNRFFLCIRKFNPTILATAYT